MKKIFKLNLINILLFLYILTLYLFTFREGMTVYSNLIACLLIVSIWFNFLLYKRKIIINRFLLIYLLFILICIISVLYALDKDIAIIKCRTLILLFILITTLVNYIDTAKKIKKIMAYFIYSGFVASIYILINSNFSYITRFGSQLGNVNAIGMIISISVIFCIYFIIKEKKYWYTVFLVLMIVVVFLTGSRKSLLFIVMNIILVLYLNNRGSLKNKFKFLIFGILALLSIYYVLFKVPLFYEILGKRINNLLDFLSGKSTSEESINERMYMIKFGIRMFKDKPFIGYGIDNYRVLLGIDYGLITYSHNNFVELMVDVGIFGLAIYYLTHILVLRNLFNLSKKMDNNILCYVFISIIISYIILSSSLVYYDDKHFAIILTLASVLYKNIEKKEVII